MSQSSKVPRFDRVGVLCERGGQHSMRDKRLKAPFPYFGGKSRVAAEVWRRLGDVDNYIEPFAGSCAVLLLRPTPPRIETVNDADPYVANFWRATERDPEAVAAAADYPVNEVDLHARHKWLVLSDDAATFRRRMRSEPEYFDARIAGLWCWGLCCWIGGGWCSTPDEVDRGDGTVPVGHGQGVTATSERLPKIGGGHGQAGNGVHAKGQDRRKPNLGGLEGQHGRGVHSKRPRLSGANGNGNGNGGEVGVNKGPSEKRIDLSGLSERDRGNGVHKRSNEHLARPQLADAFSRGRGVHGNDLAETCASRRAWLLQWFARLRDRLRTVRVCCGNWLRVCDSDSVTTRLGVCGAFFDPPYGVAAGRDMKLYATDSGTVAADVRAYCLERGSDRKMRIALAGYAGEGHEAMEKKGWTVHAWTAAGGYGNRSAKGKANAKKERIWFSPHCLTGREVSLFEEDDAASAAAS